MAEAGKTGGICVKAQNGLRKREVEKFWRILKEKKEKLEASLSAPMQSAGCHSELCDQADSNRFLEEEVRTRNWNGRELGKVNAAISRIIEGTFNQCIGPDEFHLDNEDCDGRVGINQLEASAIGQLCNHCLAELQERRKSREKKKPVARMFD
ncbi:MAG: hypothetical protein NTZ49_02655 [Candidatus Parcubacteria bacterium]|nr:hypothetical protein [Candidatus Parcubacteria bacterium]